MFIVMKRAKIINHDSFYYGQTGNAVAVPDATYYTWSVKVE